MSVRFFHDNQVSSKSADLLVGTEDSAFPLSNLANNDTSKPFIPLADGGGNVWISLSVSVPNIDSLLIGANKGDSIGFKMPVGSISLDAYTVNGWQQVANAPISTPESDTEVFETAAHAPSIPAGWQGNGLAAPVHDVKFINGKWIAVGDAGIVYSSADGTSWTSVIIAGTPNLRGIVYGSGIYTAVGLGGFIATSSDGIIWVTQTSGVVANLNGVTYYGLISVFIAVGDAGIILTSSDGVTWTASVSGVADNILSIAPGISRVVAGTVTGALFSTDGVNWTVNPTNTYGVNSLNGMMFDGLRFFAACNGGVITSYDGSVWKTVFYSAADQYHGIAFDGSTYIAAGVTGHAVSSADGDAWVVSDPVGYDVSSIAAGGGLFNVCGVSDISWRTYLYQYKLKISGQTPGGGVKIPELYIGPYIALSSFDLGTDPEALEINTSYFTSVNGRSSVARKFEKRKFDLAWDALDSVESILVKTLKVSVLKRKDPFFIQLDDTDSSSALLVREMSKLVSSPFITSEFRKLKLSFEENI